MIKVRAFEHAHDGQHKTLQRTQIHTISNEMLFQMIIMFTVGNDMFRTLENPRRTFKGLSGLRIRKPSDRLTDRKCLGVCPRLAPSGYERANEFC